MKLPTKTVEQISLEPRKGLGSPTDPIPFDDPLINLGDIGTVYVWDEEAGTLNTCNKVLHRIPSAQDHGGNPHEQYAYPIREKDKKVDTKMGYVLTCSVLKRFHPPPGFFDKFDKLVVPQGVVIYRWTQEKVIIKVTRYGRGANDPINEVAAYQKLGPHTEHVMQYKEAYVTDMLVCLVLPRCKQDLWTLLCHYQKYGKVFSEYRIRSIFRNIMQGIQEIHDRGLCHRDIKLENIMVDGEEVKIIDFGMAFQVSYDDHGRRQLIKPQRIHGTRSYMAPEIWKQEVFDSEAIDVFSAGVILFELLTGKESFHIPSLENKKFCNMTLNMSNYLKSMPYIHRSKEACDLVTQMCQYNPSNRPTVVEVLSHPWFALNENHYEI